MTTTLNHAVQRDAFKVNEVAKSLGVSVNTIYGLIYDGTIEPMRIGRSVRITRDELNRLGYPIPNTGQ